MKLFAPKYYSKFKCIADKCPHSCCVGWEIDIDKDTMKKYSRLKKGYGKEIKESIEKGDTPHFRLLDGERCYHLNEKGLCKIILNCGEEYLCQICKEHPRFYNYTNYGKEVGLGMSCMEACRIILESDEYADFCEMADSEGEAEIIEFDGCMERSKIFKILKSHQICYTEKLRLIRETFDVCPERLDDEVWKGCFYGLEYLDESHKNLFLSYEAEADVPKVLEKSLERALSYFVFRHCTEASCYEEFRISLGFCLVMERLLASMASKKPENVCEYAVILSEEIEYSIDNTEIIKNKFGE